MYNIVMYILFVCTNDVLYYNSLLSVDCLIVKWRTLDLIQNTLYSMQWTLQWKDILNIIFCVHSH